MNSATNLKSGRSPATQPASRTFSLRETKELIQDLFVPKPLLYWTDFLITVSVAYGFAAITIMAAPFSLIQVTTFLLSGAALFRVGTFIHEIVHMSGRTMIGFRVAWNVACGVPLLMHSLLYSNHLDHQTRASTALRLMENICPWHRRLPEKLCCILRRFPFCPSWQPSASSSWYRCLFSIPSSGDGCLSGGLLMPSTHTTAARSRLQNPTVSGLHWTESASCGWPCFLLWC